MSHKETMTCGCLADQIKTGPWLPVDDQPVLKCLRQHIAGDPARLFTVPPVLPLILIGQSDPAFDDSGRCWDTLHRRGMLPCVACMSVSLLPVVPG